MGLLKNRSDRVLYIACSGGPDSMFLLWILKKSNFKNLHALYFNYKTSQYSDEAERLIKEFCREHQIEFSVQTQKLETSNFEKKARSLRYTWFLKLLKKDDLLLTGHNLSDSMEWSWMQMLKSSHWRSWLGIPIKNGRIQRPLMGFSRSQIRNLLNHFGIPSVEDPSNHNLNFERNKIRINYLSELQKDYPALEKNYVARHNQLAIRYSMHAKTKVNKSSAKLKVINQNLGGTLVFLEDLRQFEIFENEVLEIILSHSNSERGSVRSQMQKLKNAFDKKKEGPMLFSGGVRVFIFHKALLIMSGSDYLKYQLWDQDFANLILRLRAESVFWEFKHWKKPSDLICQFDLKQKNKHFKPRKNIHPLFPKTTKALIQLDIPWQTRFRAYLKY